MHAIDRLGSISAAAKHMGMSYPRASRLTGEINTMFSSQIIETHQGGANKGGARLTKNGHAILNSYLKWSTDISENSRQLTAVFLNPTEGNP